MNKQERHAAIRERAAVALRDMYHNATPEYPRDVDDSRWEAFSAWLADAASAEIDYLRDGGGYGGKPRDTLQWNAERQYQSDAARAYYVRKGMRDMRRERERCNRLDSRGHAVNALWERISEFGKLYQWGRGGRTLAPDHLVKRRGGSSFSVDESAFDDLPIADCVDSLRIVESFNRYVDSWCKSVPDQWRELEAERIDSEEREENEAAFHD
jgi:hypothetical protein